VAKPGAASHPFWPPHVYCELQAVVELGPRGLIPDMSNRHFTCKAGRTGLTALGLMPTDECAETCMGTIVHRKRNLRHGHYRLGHLNATTPA
jgi:hypothetical protein